MRTRMTRVHETRTAYRIAGAFVSTVETCIERKEGRAAPIAKWIDEGWKAAQWIPDVYRKEYKDECPQVSEAARQRIMEEAREIARAQIRDFYNNGVYTYEQIKKAIS